MLVWRVGQVPWRIEGVPALKFSGQRNETFQARGRGAHQTPQSLRSITICCLVKCVVGLQELAGYVADGVPRVEISTLFVDKAEGTLGRCAMECIS